MIGQGVAAGIVLYNPGIERLRENVEAISSQVGTVFCFDNGSDNLGDVRVLLNRYGNVRLIEAGSNLGISTALNRMAAAATEQGCEWLLSLDQDSVCPRGMIEGLLPYGSMERVGAVCPAFVDRRRPQEPLPDEEWSEVDDAITSGMLMRLDVYRELGGMDERLFIGFVDDEYCYRLRLSGYRIIRVNGIVLDHELGELTPSRLRGFWLALGGALHSRKVKALSYKRKVSPMRVYYGARNAVYLERKYRDYPNPMFSRGAALKSGISNILRSQDKREVAKALRSGLKAGKTCEVEAWKQ